MRPAPPPPRGLPQPAPLRHPRSPGGMRRRAAPPARRQASRSPAAARSGARGQSPRRWLSRASPCCSQKAVSASIASSPSTSTPLSSRSGPWSASVSWTSAVRLGGRMRASSPRSGCEQLEQPRMEDVALAHVDDPVAARLVEADQHPPAGLQRPQRRPPAGARRRQMRRPDFRLQPMLGKRAGHSRHAIVGIGVIGQVLELASAAFREMAAWRRLVARAMLERAVIEQRVARAPRRGHGGRWR